MKKDSEIKEFINAHVEYEESNLIHKDEFYSLGEEYHSYETKYRVIGWFHNKNQHPRLYRSFKEAASHLANRDDLRIGTVHDRTVVQRWLKHYQPKLGSNAKNFLVLYNSADPEDIRLLDIENDKDADIESWITRQSLPGVMKLNPVNAKQIHMLKMPIFVAFIDQQAQS